MRNADFGLEEAESAIRLSIPMVYCRNTTSIPGTSAPLCLEMGDAINSVPLCLEIGDASVPLCLEIGDASVPLCLEI